jgi:hypothetical protein
MRLQGLLVFIALLKFRFKALPSSLVYILFDNSEPIPLEMPIYFESLFTYI